MNGETLAGAEGGAHPAPEEAERHRAVRIAREYLDEAMRKAEPPEVQRKRHAKEVCTRWIQEKGIPIRFVDAQFGANNVGVTIFYSAEGKVDFRDLVGDLAREFRLRVTMRRLGPRDEAARLGQVGPCGRGLCCKTWLKGYPPVSVKMAKAQDFPLSPNRSAGACGRLKCCLAYEMGAEGYVNRGCGSGGG